IAPRVTLFNGQRAYVKVTTSRAFVASLTLMQNGATKSLQPEIRNVDSGIILDIQATSSADRKYVTLTLRPQMANLLSLESKQVERDGVVGTVQVPNVELMKFESTIQVPDKGTLAILLHPQTTLVEQPEGGVAAVQQPVVLLVKPMLIVQRETEEKQFP